MSNLAIQKASQILGSQAELARHLGVSRGFVGQMAIGLKPVPVEHCPAIEKATSGAVRCEDLRPDIEWAVLRCNCSEQQAA